MKVLRIKGESAGDVLQEDLKRAKAQGKRKSPAASLAASLARHAPAGWLSCSAMPK